MKKLSIYLASLVHAQLKNTIPEDLPDAISVSQIIEIAVNNQMICLLLGGLVRTNISEEDKEKIRPAVKSSLLRSLIQSKEFDKIEALLEQEQVMNQPMKGILLKQLYPQPTLREMSDLDILIHDNCMPQAEKALKLLGYELEKKVKHHEVYVKSPFMIVEAHRAMYDKNVDKGQYEYFSDFSKAELKKDCSYTYMFSREDFYVYMMAHMAKHFYEQGCGIRNLVDIYVYKDYYKEQLDESYIEKELNKCGILVFSKHMEKLTNIWLGEAKSNSFYDDLFQYMLDGGVYGKEENGIWNEFAKEKEITDEHSNFQLQKFYFFPPKRYMTHYYPWVKDRKILLPIAWTIRAFNGVFGAKEAVRKDLVRKIDRDRIKMMQKIYKKMDFNFKQ